MKKHINIHVHYDPSPTPYRTMDWHAITDDYEEGHPVGYGATPREAVVDLMERLEAGEGESND